MRLLDDGKASRNTAGLRPTHPGSPIALARHPSSGRRGAAALWRPARPPAASCTSWFVLH